MGTPINLDVKSVSERIRSPGPWPHLDFRIIGAVLPGGRTRQLNDLVSLSTNPDRAEISGINREVLRARFPDLCGQLDGR